MVGSEEVVLDDAGESGVVIGDGILAGISGLLGKSSFSSATVGVFEVSDGTAVSGFETGLRFVREFLRTDSCTVVMIAAAAAAAILVVLLVGLWLFAVLLMTSSMVSSTVLREPPSFSWFKIERKMLVGNKNSLNLFEMV